MSNASWIERLSVVECPDGTYTEFDPPLVFERGEGSTIWDADNRSYTDLCAGFGVMALGHAHPVVEKVWKQTFEERLIIHGMGDVYPSVDKIRFLEKMRNLLPAHLTRGALALSGSQAVEIALKTAMLATRRSGIIAFQGGYHGLDLGTLPLLTRKDFYEPFEGWTQRVQARHLPYGCTQDALAVAADSLAEHGLAAVIVEPIQGRAGVRHPPTGWLKEVAAFCAEAGALLIFDEVFVGMGRTGRITHAAEVPADLVCLGKALGGGLPLSACFGTEKAMIAWPKSQGEAIHTGTFFGHPLSCRLGEAVLEELVSERLAQRSLELGQKALQFLKSKCDATPAIKAVRGTGLMLALEGEPLFGLNLMNALRTRGIIALVSGEKGETLSITPALTIPEKQFFAALETVMEVASSLE